MKKIIIYCDGTWNTPDKTDKGIPLATNVVKIAESVLKTDDKGIDQKVYYDTGIGSSGSWFKRIFNGATGTGISKNIIQAYEYLIKLYEPEDQLFLFGFSRGAFTVRSLAGLIRNCGILQPEFSNLVKQAYKLYKSRSKASKPKEREATLFRQSFAYSNKTNIHFIGVWDTVGALGNPILINSIFNRRNRFHDTDLSSKIKNAYHAIAIDEKRRNFNVTLWNQQEHEEEQNLEQRWFVGVHSDIGGGNKLTGLSDIALEWLVKKATDCGLALKEIPMDLDDLQDIQESWKGIYRIQLFPFHRQIDKPKKEKNPKKQIGPTNEVLDESVIERYNNDPTYRPMEPCNYFDRHSNLIQ